MAKEIERKFLVNNRSFMDLAAHKICIKQAYLSRKPEATVRVRLYGEEAFLTIKGVTHGATRDEWEYQIPIADACDMIERLSEGTVIDKTRYIVMYGGLRWEIDVFHGVHEGLIVAEVELTSETQHINLPPFIGREVTGDPQYYNSNLAK